MYARVCAAQMIFDPFYLNSHRRQLRGKMGRHTDRSGEVLIDVCVNRENRKFMCGKRPGRESRESGFAGAAFSYECNSHRFSIAVEDEGSNYLQIFRIYRILPI